MKTEKFSTFEQWLLCAGLTLWLVQISREQNLQHGGLKCSADPGLDKDCNGRIGYSSL